MTHGSGCWFIRAANASEHFPELQGITPRPEPDYNDVDAWHEWNEEYQLWGNVKCPCRTGYFCKEHGEWISGADIKAGNAPYQEQEDYFDCPPRHYNADAEGSGPPLSRTREPKDKPKCVCSEPCPTPHDSPSQPSSSSKRVSQRTRGPASRDDSRETPYASSSHRLSPTGFSVQYHSGSASSASQANPLYQYEDPYDTTPRDVSRTHHTHYSISQQPIYDHEYDYQNPYDNDNDNFSSDLQQSGDMYYPYEEAGPSTQADAAYGQHDPLEYVLEDFHQLDLGPGTVDRHLAPDDDPQTSSTIAREDDGSQRRRSHHSTRRHPKEQSHGTDDKGHSSSKKHKSHSSKDHGKHKGKDKR